MISQNIPFTREGVEDLKTELEERRLARPAIIKELQRARELGDLSENGLYKATKSQLIDTDRRMRLLNHLIKNAKVEEIQNTGVVRIGNSIMLESKGKEFTYQLVGTYESDPSKGKISVASPLGKLITGKKVGDIVTLKRDEDIEFKIIGIE